jgi:PST family polysaccharide transporter
MISAILNKGFSNFDYFIVGKWLGTEALGYYTLAFQLTVAPLRRFTSVLHQVAFPAFSSIQTDQNRLRTGFTQGTQHLLVIVVPVSLFLVALGPYFIEALYGQQWLPAAPLLRVLALAGLFYAFDIAGSVYFAVGKPQFRVWIIALGLTLFAVFVSTFGLSSGIVGVAMSLTLSVALSSSIGFVISGRITGATLRELLTPLWPAARAAASVSLFVITAYLFLPSRAFSSWFVIVGLGSIMSVIYVVALIPTYSPLIKRMCASAQQYMHR